MSQLHQHTEQVQADHVRILSISVAQAPLLNCSALLLSLLPTQSLPYLPISIVHPPIYSYALVKNTGSSITIYDSCVKAATDGNIIVTAGVVFHCWTQHL